MGDLDWKGYEGMLGQGEVRIGQYVLDRFDYPDALPFGPTPIAHFPDENVRIEDRLITASLRAYDGAEREEVVELFHSFAIFPATLGR